MGVSLRLTAYAGRESKEFLKHYKAVQFCIENELSFPVETSEFFRGKIEFGDLEDYDYKYILEKIENGVEVPIKHSNLNFEEIRIKVKDIPSSVEELVIKLS